MANENQTALMMSIQRKKDKIVLYTTEIEKLNALKSELKEGVSEVYSNAIACLKDEITEDEKLLAVDREQIEKAFDFGKVAEQREYPESGADYFKKQYATDGK